MRSYRQKIFEIWPEFKILHDIVTQLKHVQLSDAQSEEKICIDVRTEKTTILDESIVFGFGTRHEKFKPVPRTEIRKVLYFNCQTAVSLLSQIWYFWSSDLYEKRLKAGQ